MFTQQAFCDVIKAVSQDKDKFDELAILKANTILETIPDKEYKTVLGVGFSLVAYGMHLLGYDVKLPAGCCDSFGVPVSDKTVSEMIAYAERSDLVLAVDQYTTYIDTNYNQQKLVSNLGRLTNKTLVTTLRDYKNQKPNEKMFDEPFYLKYNDTQEFTVLNQRKWSHEDRQSFMSYTYIMNEKQETICLAPVQRRTMYFKQLAKFLTDVGATNYRVHKTPMYKAVLSRNFEYIITADF